MSDPQVADEQSIVAVLEAAAAARPDAVALVDGAATTTTRTLRDEAFGAAEALIGAGLPSGARVALWGSNSAEWAIANLAVLAAGCTVVPLSTRAATAEAADICARADVALVIAEKEFHGRGYLAEAAQFASGIGVWALRPAEWGASAAASPRTRVPSGDDVSHVQFTSGTTGLPKGAMLRHRAMVTTTRTWVSLTGLAPGDTYTIVSPCSHIAGHKTGLLACLVAGATAVPVAMYSAPDLADLIDTIGVTFLQAAPTVFHDLVSIARSRGYGFASIRTAVTGAATIPPALISDLRNVAGIPIVMAAYGLTEATGVVAITSPDDPIDVISTSVGRPIPGVELRIVDPSGVELEAGERGEIVLRGESVMAGYLDSPESTAEVTQDGWLHTGDIGTTDADGRLHVVDRLKDLILVGGFNVHPAEVEHVLVEHPAVREAAVVGVRDDRLGEVPVAHVVPDGPLDEEDVLAFCRARLASYKVPRRIIERLELPRNTAGKVLKRSLQVP